MLNTRVLFQLSIFNMMRDGKAWNAQMHELCNDGCLAMGERTPERIFRVSGRNQTHNPCSARLALQSLSFKNFRSSQSLNFSSAQCLASTVASTVECSDH